MIKVDGDNSIAKGEISDIIDELILMHIHIRKLAKAKLNLSEEEFAKIITNAIKLKGITNA